MRVLYFTGAYRPDSMISHTHGELVAALRGRGVDIEMLSTAPREHEPVATITDPFGNRVWYVRAHAGTFDRIYRAWSARRWQHAPFLSHVHALRGFFTPERRAAYDLLHVGMAYPYATILRRALDNAQAPPTIVTTTGGDIMTDEETGYGYNRAPAIHRETARTLAWAALVQANSPRSAEAVRGYGCPTERIVVQPPQSPQEPVPSAHLAERRAAARSRLLAAGAIPAGRLLFGLGRMEPIKGYDDVIRAMPAVLARCPDVTAIFAGPTRTPAAQTFAAKLTALAAAQGVSDHVQIRGQIPYDDVPDYIAAADLVLIPSLLDGLNKTGLEAAAFGTPVIVSERAGLAHYVRQYHAGTVIPPRAPDALAAAMTALLTDSGAWQTASAGASTLAEAFSLSSTADAIVSLYERVLNAGERTAPVLYSPPAAQRAGGGGE
jgi:glycosyltransferase involved in cell wall biosynthesis